MTEKFKPKVRLMEMARRNRTTRAFLSSRENPQMRLRRLNNWSSPKDEENGKINLTPHGQLVIWEANEISGK